MKTFKLLFKANDYIAVLGIIALSVIALLMWWQASIPWQNQAEEARIKIQQTQHGLERAWVSFFRAFAIVGKVTQHNLNKFMEMTFKIAESRGSESREGLFASMVSEAYPDFDYKLAERFIVEVLPMLRRIEELEEVLLTAKSAYDQLRNTYPGYIYLIGETQLRLEFYDTPEAWTMLATKALDDQTLKLE